MALEIDYNTKFKDEMQVQQKEINDLIDKLKHEKKAYKHIPFHFFEEPLFQKYHKDERFLSQYIQLIENEGLYEHTPYLKRLKYKKIHQKFYSKKEYSKLYKVLKPYLYMYIPLMIEELILICGYYYSTTLCFETEDFLKYGLILLFVLIYYPIQMKKMKFHSSLESIIITKGFAWAYFFYYFLLGISYYKY